MSRRLFSANTISHRRVSCRITVSIVSATQHALSPDMASYTQLQRKACCLFTRRTLLFALRFAHACGHTLLAEHTRQLRAHEWRIDEHAVRQVIVTNSKIATLADEGFVGCNNTFSICSLIALKTDVPDWYANRAMRSATKAVCVQSDSQSVSQSDSQTVRQRFSPPLQACAVCAMQCGNPVVSRDSYAAGTLHWHDVQRML
eukprot:1195858-Prorocentrum_minimum.AAC.3